MIRASLLLSILLSVASTASAQTFRRPFTCDTCIAGWFYFDEDASGGVEDWNCLSSSYDGHRGNDFSLRGGNGAIDMGWDVVAGADGTVESVQDGHFDRCTACGGSGCGLDFGFGFGNHVVINHGAYKVVYAHMRNGSVRVAPGDRVTCGDVVGQIASSGCSTGAHLHFETRPLGGGYMTAFDPFAGACSPTSPTLWTEQGAHRSIPGPTCDGTPPPPMCPAGTYPIWTCDAARTSRRRCEAGVDTTEPCPYGCVSMPVGVDDVCMSPPDADGDGSPADVDCDDANAAIHPGATDTCGDAIDQDCAGGDAVCPGTDGGPPPIDEDAGTIDAQVPPGTDGGPRADASRSDAGTSRPDGGITGGCSCAAGGREPSPAHALAMIALGVAIATRREKRNLRRKAERPEGETGSSPS